MGRRATSTYSRRDKKRDAIKKDEDSASDEEKKDQRQDKKRDVIKKDEGSASEEEKTKDPKEMD